MKTKKHESAEPTRKKIKITATHSFGFESGGVNPATLIQNIEKAVQKMIEENPMIDIEALRASPYSGFAFLLETYREETDEEFAVRQEAYRKKKQKEAEAKERMRQTRARQLAEQMRKLGISVEDLNTVIQDGQEAGSKVKSKKRQ